MAGFKGTEILIFLVLILVLFGGAKIPQLARNLGRAQKEFKDGMDTGGSESPESSDSSV